MSRMTDENDWQYFRAQELRGLAEYIALAGKVFPTCEVEIEDCRHYGLTLLFNGIETARAILHCIRKNLPGPAFALARTLYESVLRGHVIVHEISLAELNEILEHTREWQRRNALEVPPPKIELKKKRWRTVTRGARGNPDFGKWRMLGSEDAIRLQESVLGMPVLHDLTHGGFSQALQMRDTEGTIGTHHSTANQTLVLYFSERAVLFSLLAWPGAVQKYLQEIEQIAEETIERVSPWERGF